MLSEPPQRRAVVLLGVLVEGGLAVLAWLLGWLIGQPPLAALRLELRGLAWGAVATLPLLALFALCLRLPLAPLERIRQFFDEVVRPFLARCTIADLACIALAAGVGEEMLFRGVIQPALAARLGTLPALAASNLLFGLLHPITPTYVLLAGLMGAYLGLVGAASGNLLVVVVAHGLYDFLALVYLLRVQPPRVPAVVAVRSSGFGAQHEPFGAPSEDGRNAEGRAEPDPESSRGDSLPK